MVRPHWKLGVSVPTPAWLPASVTLRKALYEPIDNRRFREDHRGYDHHEVEKAMLLNPDARLGADGYYEA